MPERVYDPNRRQHYEFRREGDALIVDVFIAPGGDVPTHIHPHQEERWTVIAGRVRFKVDGCRSTPDPGVTITVPAGVRHSFKSVGGEEAHARAEVRPAMRLQEFLEDGAALARAGLYTRRGLVKSPRGAIQMAKFIERYGDETVVCWPPRMVQRLLSPLARLGERTPR
jgi:quercetin dioxygenase-like cupin family protein